MNGIVAPKAAQNVRKLRTTRGGAQPFSRESSLSLVAVRDSSLASRALTLAVSGHCVRSTCRRYSRVSHAEVCLSTVQSEIAALEERLRVAELGPDPKFFEEVLADDMVLVSQKGDPAFAKRKVIEAHQPGKGPKFTRVEMRNMNIIDHGTAAVVTCEGTFEGPQSTITLKFMRVWLNRNNRWQILAGFVSA